MSNYVNPARFLKPELHPDVTYLLQEELGGVIGEALGNLYEAKPANPLHYLGNWLLNLSAARKKETRRKERESQKKTLIDKHKSQLIERQKAEKKKEEEREEKTAIEDSFRRTISSAKDCEDMLPQLCEYVKTTLQTTGVYVGKLEKLKKPIGELDDERAHENPDAPFIVRYVAANESQAFMIDKKLTEEEGPVTFSVWAAREEEDESKGDESIDQSFEKPKEEVVKTGFVPDVVRADKMKFFDVPKLGSYLAVPLTYNSCIFEAAWDAAIDDALEIRKQRAELEVEKVKGDQGSVHGEEQEEEIKTDNIIEAPFKTEPLKYVICIDTLGQDRVISENDKKYCIEIMKFYRSEWERSEFEALRRDVQIYINQKDEEEQSIHDKQTEWAEEEKIAHDDALRDLDPSTSEEKKNFAVARKMLEVYRNRLLDPKTLESLLHFKKFRICKYAKVFQVSLYYFGVRRDRVVEPGTNKIHWKRARKCLSTGFVDYLKHENPFGPRPVKPPAYAKTLRLQKEFARVKYEEVMSYSLPLAILFKFVQQCLAVRVMDVKMRRNSYLSKKEDREAALQAAEEHVKKRTQALEEARIAHEKENETLDADSRTPFDEMKFLLEFDETEGNAAIEIPPEISPDEDGDIDWEETHPKK
jgi:hypothetical protein